MESTTSKPELIAIVGPTASGKSDLAMRIAKDFHGEIISADSLTIYKNMDIGTAKPTKADQRRIPHWGLNIIGPGERFTAAQFKQYAENKIIEIQKRGHLPVIVGGTGLYIDSILYDYSFSPTGKRDSLNPRHRLEGSYTKNKNLRNDAVIIGLLQHGDELKQRISKRAEAMFKEGLVEETERLLQQYGRNAILTKAKVAYGPIIEYLSGTISEAEAREKLKTSHWQYARRQKTWFKRNSYIQWFSSANETYKFVADTLSN